VSLGESIFLFFAALVAGVINSVAGGGSFLTFPALLVSGISPIVANATNTAALWPGIVASGVAYRNAFTPEARRLVPALIVTGVIGGVLGARILLVTPQATFMRLVPWLLLAATLLFVASGRITRWVRARTSQGRGPRLLMAGGLLLELMIAIYIGYFGAGIGILLLALLALLGLENIHAMNGIKTILVGVCNGVALVVFIWAKAIVWPQALLMLVGASIGGYGGAYYAQRMNPKHVRWLVIAVGFGVSAYFFIRH
jgi:uncharacterized membrane protein YfcA